MAKHREADGQRDSVASDSNITPGSGVSPGTLDTRSAPWPRFCFQRRFRLGRRYDRPFAGSGHRSPQINMLVRNVVNGVEGDPQVGQTLAIVIDPDGTPDIVKENTIDITAYLDTGTSSTLLSTDTASVWGIPNSTFNGQQVQFQDIGIGGSANFTVSKPVTIHSAVQRGHEQHAVAGELGRLCQLLLSTTRCGTIRNWTQRRRQRLAHRRIVFRRRECRRHAGAGQQSDGC